MQRNASLSVPNWFSLSPGLEAFRKVLAGDWKEFAAHSWWCFRKGSSEWIKGYNFHAISVQFSFLLMFSFFEMAMIAIQFCPHSTACLNEPFITNFLSFCCLRFYLLRNLFFFINVYRSSCITITFSNYYLLRLILFYSPDVASEVAISKQLHVTAATHSYFTK